MMLTRISEPNPAQRLPAPLRRKPDSVLYEIQILHLMRLLELLGRCFPQEDLYAVEEALLQVLCDYLSDQIDY